MMSVVWKWEVGVGDGGGAGGVDGVVGVGV